MSCKCHIISFGKTNKYIFFIFIGAILRALLTYVESLSKNFYKENLHPVIYSMTYSIGLSLSFILFIIYKIRTKSEKDKVHTPLLESNDNNSSIHNSTIALNNQIKQYNFIKKLLWILLASIIDYIAYIFFCIYWVNFDNYLNTWAFTIIFMSLFSRWILKIKLYKHHYLGIITVVIVGSLYNVILRKLNKENFENNYSSYLSFFFTETLFSLLNVLYKYYIHKKYIKSYEILFIEGIIEFILGVITLVITTSMDVLDNYYEFIKQIDTNEIHILFYLTSIQFLLYTVQIIIIDLFSPFHVFLLKIITEFILFFGFYENINIWESILIIFCIFICIFMILVFIEIIELNFLGLSTMTKKNIELRAQLDIKDDDKDEEKGGIDYKGYILNLKEDENKGSLEMQRMNSYNSYGSEN